MSVLADSGLGYRANYRPDIDGLRAVAIISVIFFHAFPSVLPGGFAGVDIFFVISGFLISSIIIRNLNNNKFSFIEFYDNRVRRIFPSLIVVLTACYIFGWFYLLPDEFKQLGKHIAAGAGFVQNLALWQEAGYFDKASELKPLMHLWSLAIEEQFYLIYPVLIFGAWRTGINSLPIIIILAMISFWLNTSWIEKNAVKTFFMPQTRFWELLAGSTLAYFQFFKLNTIRFCFKHKTFYHKIFRHWLILTKQQTIFIKTISIIGGGLVFFAVTTINKEESFPGWWALLPVAGAILLIISGPNAWLNQNILGSRLLVFVGVISYPLYLWHWPILSFTRIIESEMPALDIRIAAIVLSFILAWLTYQIIEKPIRFGKKSYVKTVGLVTLTATVGYIGLNVFFRDGLEFRFNRITPETSLQIKKISKAWKFSGYPVPSTSWIDQATGLKGVGENTGRLILFIGDSHALQYKNSIQSFYEKKRITDAGALFLFPNFPPTIDDKIFSDQRITDVVFTFYWSYQYGSETVNQAMRCCGTGKNGVVGSYTSPLRNNSEMQKINLSMESILNKTAASGKKIWIILDNPFGEELDAHSKISRSFYGGISISPPEKLSLEKALKRTEPVRSFLINISHKTGARIVDPFKNLCTDTECPMFSDDGNLLYKDYDHLSLLASRNHTSYLLDIFDDASHMRRN